MNSNDHGAAGPTAPKRLKLSFKNNDALTQKKEMASLVSDSEWNDSGDKFFPEDEETSTDKGVASFIHNTKM